MRSPLRVLPILALTVAVATVLGGCSLLPQLQPKPTPTPTIASVSAACDALEDEARASSTAMVEGSGLLPTDRAGSAEILAAAAARFEKAAAAVENEKVSKLATDTSESINHLSELVTAFAADPTDTDPDDALPAAATESNTTFSALAEFCSWSEPVKASCDTLLVEATAVNAEMSVASDLLSTDPTTGAGMLAEAAARFDEAAAAVENEDVSALAAETSDKLNVFSGLINVLAADPAHPDNEALSAGSDDLNAAFNELATFCDW